jgi:hypothetical protein
MCSVIHQKSRNLWLPISLQLHLFNSMVVPILPEGSEVWGFEQVQILEKFQMHFCKFIMNLKSSTPNCMDYGEFGIFPLVFCIIQCCLCPLGILLILNG